MSKNIIKQRRILTKAGGGAGLAIPVTVPNGGTGISSYAIGDLIYASGATTLSKLADVATGSVLVSGGVGVAPSWSTSLTLTSNISAGAAGSIGFTGRSIIKSPADGFFAFSNAAATAFADVVVGTVTSGNASSTNGSFILKNSTNANTVTITSGVTSSSYSWTLPTAQGGASTVLTNNGSGVLSWTTPSTGITIGGTAITSGADYRVLFQDATASDYVTQTANFTMGSVAAGYLDVPSGYARAGVRFISSINDGICIGNTNAQTGNHGGFYNTIIGFGAAPNVGNTYYQNTVIGYTAGSNITYANVIVGELCGYASTIGRENTILGIGACSSITVGDYNVSIGRSSNVYGSGSTALGYSANTGNSFNYSIALGHTATCTSSNQLVIGNSTTSFISNIFLNSVTNTTAQSVVLNACGGSGSNNAGANLTLAAGKSTGSATPAVINFQSTAAGASSSTAQTLATVLQITNSTTITTSDAVNYALGSTTGTKFGTATTQKLAFWNATPIVQPTTGISAAAFTANTSGTLDDSATYGGYTIGQIVAALKAIGLLA